MKREKARKNGGFTLIELVVVIAIIGVLAGVVAPRIRLSLMKSKDAKVVATLDALRTAANVYYAEQGTVPSVYIEGTVDGNTITARADLPNEGDPLTTSDVYNLLSKNYIDAQAAKKLIGTAGADEEIITAAGVVQLKSTECEDPDNDGIFTPTADAQYTQGNVIYVWAADGVGINAVAEVPGTDKTPETLTNGVGLYTDASCQLWSDK